MLAQQCASMQSGSTLGDFDLSRIFKYLAPLERLRASEICRGWTRAARMDWLDVTRIDLTGIPTESVGAILSYCPNLKAISGNDQTLILEDVRRNIRSSNLESIEFYNIGVSFKPVDEPTDLFIAYDVPKLKELVWHNLSAKCRGEEDVDPLRGFGFCFTGLVPEANLLTHLQVSGTHPIQAIPFFEALARLPNLECLILADEFLAYAYLYEVIKEKFCQALAAMPKLRELSLINVIVRVTEEAPGDISHGRFAQFVLVDCFDLLVNLEVFILVEEQTEAVFYKDILIELHYNGWLVHPSLRVFVVALTKEACDVDHMEYDEADDAFYYPMPDWQAEAAERYNTEPLPFLNFFLGGHAARNFVFPVFQNAKNWNTTAPLDKYLEQPEIALIFDGVWAAEVIAKMSERGVKLCDYASLENQHATIPFLGD